MAEPVPEDEDETAYELALEATHDETVVLLPPPLPSPPPVPPPPPPPPPSPPPVPPPPPPPRAAPASRQLGWHAVRPDAASPLPLPMHRPVPARLRGGHARAAISGHHPPRPRRVAAHVPPMLAQHARTRSVGCCPPRALVLCRTRVGTRASARARTRIGTCVHAGRTRFCVRSRRVRSCTCEAAAAYVVIIERFGYGYGCLLWSSVVVV